MDSTLQALADDSRRTILARLREGEASAGELGERLAVAQPGVSRHLRVLREAGLVQVREEGRNRIYSLTPAPLAELDDWLEPYRAIWAQRLDALHTEIARVRRTARSADTDINTDIDTDSEEPS